MNNDYYGQPADTEYYGKDADRRQMTLGERLRTYYEPEDFVTVQNIDTEPIRYQFARPGDVETFSNHPGHKETVMKRPPQVVVLQPGQTKLCPAYEADLMIENLIKKMTMRKANKKDKEEFKGTGRVLADWTDPTTQKELIEKTFLGKEDVVRTYNESLNDVKGKK